MIEEIIGGHQTILTPGRQTYFYFCQGLLLFEHLLDELYVISRLFTARASSSIFFFIFNFLSSSFLLLTAIKQPARNTDLSALWEHRPSDWLL